MPDSHRDRSTATRRLLALALGLAMLAPAGAAYHLSAGAEGVVGLSPHESPEDPDTSRQLYERGTRTDCPEPASTDPAFVTSDAFCGHLVYNEGTTFQTESPQDQVAQRGVTIDLQMASYVGLYGITTCSPWCNAPFAYDAVHTVGSELGLTPASDDVDDGGTQAYGGNTYAASPMQVYAQADRSWLLPVTDTSFVAFVHGDQGHPVGPTELSRIVQNAKEAGDLSTAASAEVCVFTPEAHLGTHAPDSGRCEVALDWIGAEDGQDPCDADTYVCDATQPAWRGTTMCPMWHAACYLSDAWNSAHHFAVWHGVVAPSPPTDCGAAEPGFRTDDVGFLAHDLDVYTPPSDETPAQGVPHAWDEASRNVPGLGPLRDGRAPAIADTPAGQTVQATPAFSQHDPEPNNGSWLGIEESSHQLQAERTVDACQTLASGEEEADPWVNVVDAHVTRDVAGFGVAAGSEQPDRDPKPTLRVTGEVGIFADVDDDDRYEQAPASEVFHGVEKHGAYPILWDHHARGEGCAYRSGTTIGDLTTDAGYADPTGLVVTLRLSDGTLVDARDGDVLPIPAPTAVVLLSEGLDPADATVKDVVGQAAGDRPTIVLENAFQPQCGEPTGGFTSAWEIQTEPMEGDGIAAAAIATLPDGGPGGPDSAVPASPIELSGTNVWWDVDPFTPGVAS